MYTAYSHFYKRFSAESEIRQLAIKHTHSYHLGVFVSCREQEEKEYNFLDVAEAERTLAHALKAVASEQPIGDRHRLFKPSEGEEMQEGPGEEAKEGGVQGRGRDALASPLQCSNFAMIYGTKPAHQVGGETKPMLVDNLFGNILNKQDKVTLSVEFPGVLSQIRTDDANFELSLSNTIQKLTLYHKDSTHKPMMNQFKNTVGKAIGVIVVNRAAKNKTYSPGTFKDPKTNMRTQTLSVDDELDATQAMFRDLKMDASMLVLEDRTKKELIQDFERLQQEALEYESHHTDGEVLTIFVRWIGLDVQMGDLIEGGCIQTPPTGHVRTLKAGGRAYSFTRHGLTVDGKPFCVDDYCLRLANNPSTHVVLIQDQCVKGTVQEGDIDWSENFNDLKLTEARGLSRFSCYHSKAGTVHMQIQELSKLVRESGQPVFCVPDAFYNADFKADRGAWMEDNFEGRITFDLRNEGQKRNEFQSDKSFKKDLDLWEDKPQIIASEEVEKHAGNNSVVYPIPEQQQILLIVKKRGTPKVDFEFYDDSPPFSKKRQEFAVAGTEDARAMLATDLRTSHDSNTYYAAVKDEKSLQLVQIRFDNGTNSDGPKRGPVQKVRDTTEGLVNAFVLNRNKILFVMTQSTVVYDTESKLTGLHPGRQLFQLNCAFTCCIPDESSGVGAPVHRFLIGFTEPTKNSQPEDQLLAPDNIYEGQSEREGTLSYVAQVTFDAGAGKLVRTAQDLPQALALKREQVNSLMQFGQGAKKLLVAVKTQLLLFDDWRFSRAYKA